MIDVLCTLSGAFVGLAAYTVLDAIVPRELRVNCVGGLTHWRVGRYGGTFYRKVS